MKKIKNQTKNDKNFTYVGIFLYLRSMMNLNLTTTINFDHIVDRELRRDVIGLCRKTGKPVLKLSTKDYVDNGLQHYVEEYGSAGLVNIAVFNILQHTITGWPGGKPNADDSTRPERALPYPKRVIVFSPHPDDDVISMGGTIRRLMQQQHDVHIAYETSGNIAVADEEVRLYMHFIRAFNELFANGSDEIVKHYSKSVLEFLKRKEEGDLDNRDVLAIKGLIRRGEARNACGYNGIKKDHIHFLDLPFYESGKIEKLLYRSCCNRYSRTRFTWRPTWLTRTGRTAHVPTPCWRPSTRRRRRERNGSPTVAYGCTAERGRNGR